MRTKIIGLVAIAVLAMTAVVGVSSASAAGTALCKTKTIAPECAEADRYINGTGISGTSSQVSFLPYEYSEENEAFKFQCSSSLSVKLGTWGQPQMAKLQGLAFSNCKSTYNGAACSASAKNLPYSSPINWTAGSNGTITMENGGTGTPALTVACSGWGPCIYSATNVGLDLLGGQPASIVASKELMTLNAAESAVDCGLVGHNLKISGTYTLSPSPIYVAHL